MRPTRRKPLSAADDRRQFTIRLPPDLAKDLEAHLQLSGASRNDLFRDAVATVLYRHDHIEDQLANLSAELASLRDAQDEAKAHAARLEALVLKCLEYAVATWFASREILRAPLAPEQLKTILTGIGKEADEEAQTIYQALLETKPS